MRYRIISAFLLLSSFSAYQLAKYFQAEESKYITLHYKDTISKNGIESNKKYKVSYKVIRKDSLFNTDIISFVINEQTKANDSIQLNNTLIIIDSIKLVYLERKQ